MKTIITTLFLLLAFSYSHAQTDGPTKEETIEWLSINGKNLSYAESASKYNSKKIYKRYFDRVENESVIFVLRDTDGDYSEFKIPITSILYQDVETLKVSKDDYYTNAPYYIEILLSPSGKLKASSYNIYAEKGNLEDTKRVLKAIMHLAKVSGAKENKQLF